MKNLKIGDFIENNDDIYEVIAIIYNKKELHLVTVVHPERKTFFGINKQNLQYWKKYAPSSI